MIDASHTDETIAFLQTRLTVLSQIYHLYIGYSRAAKTLSSGTRDGKGNEDFLVETIQTTSHDLVLQSFIPCPGRPR
jgi:hypothetical protein